MCTRCDAFQKRLTALPLAVMSLLLLDVFASDFGVNRLFNVIPVYKEQRAIYVRDQGRISQLTVCLTEKLMSIDTPSGRLPLACQKICIMLRQC